MLGEVKYAAGGRALRLCIDGRSGALAEGTGVARYAEVLAHSLKTAGLSVGRLVASGQDTRFERWWHAASCRPARATHDASVNGSVDIWTARELFRRAHVHFNIYGRLLSIDCPAPPDVMHWTYPLPLRFLGARNVYTIHDLIPLTHPQLTPIRRARHMRILRAVAAAADHIVTVSEHSRHQIISLLDERPEKVTNTSQAVAFPTDSVEGKLRAPSEGYFLFCGSIEPRKNLQRLVEAHQASQTKLALILAGPDGWNADAALSPLGVTIRPLTARRSGERGGVWRAPWLEPGELLALQRGARALLFPSLAEGFGLPIAEAMTLGVPVMTSANGGTGETAANAALLVDPLDNAAMAQAITALASDDALCASLAMAGQRRAADFAPGPYAERLLSLYEQLMKDAR